MTKFKFKIGDSVLIPHPKETTIVSTNIINRYQKYGPFHIEERQDHHGLGRLYRITNNTMLESWPEGYWVEEFQLEPAIKNIIND